MSKDKIIFEIDGSQWSDFESITARKSILNLCGTCTFTMVKKGSQMPFGNGSTIRVFIGTEINRVIAQKEIIFNGYIEDIVVDGDASNDIITLECRDKTVDVLQSTIAGTFNFKNGISLVSLAKQVLDKIGIANIDVNIDTNVSDFTEAELKLDNDEVAAVYTGESVYSFLERYSRKKQVLLTTDKNGNLLFTRTANTPINTFLYFGDKRTNILRRKYRSDDSNRFNTYNCYSHYDISAIPYNAKAVPANIESNTVGTAVDDDIRSSRVLNFVAESPLKDNKIIEYKGKSQAESKDNDSKNRAIWESNVRRVRAFNYVCTVAGYKAKEDGIAWRPNMLVRLIDITVNISSQLVTNSVTYTLTNDANDGGARTELELLSKDTFNLLEIQGAAARKKKAERIEGRKFSTGA